jgi:DivIVA domain-containing protein
VELDRQSVERRDFPISRRGYDPAAVDAHLRALAVEIEELERSLETRGGETLGSAAATQVQSILEAAESTAASIEQQAAAEAAQTRDAAARDAERTRAEAVARAQRHVQAVSAATAVLRERVESMDSEVSALVQSLRAGAGRLAADLGSVETNMGELYDAASGASPAAQAASADEPLDALDLEEHWPMDSDTPLPGGGAVEGGAPRVTRGAEPAEVSVGLAAGAPSATTPGSTAPGSASAGSATAGSAAEDDLDGARLIALNMALNGEPREQADSYLAENFELADREKLLDEVYAAIEG